MAHIHHDERLLRTKDDIAAEVLVAFRNPGVSTIVWKGFEQRLCLPVSEGAHLRESVLRQYLSRGRIPTHEMSSKKA
jgi:hypothetical protein